MNVHKHDSVRSIAVLFTNTEVENNVIIQYMTRSSSPPSILYNADVISTMIFQTFGLSPVCSNGFLARSLEHSKASMPYYRVSFSVYVCTNMEYTFNVVTPIEVKRPPGRFLTKY